ncbi:MAG: arsenate reductase ArsC [Nitrosarchaeum sp.]|nr:arsenate reductase ArsC [Nitrosarchaeum sp.]
MKKILFVCVENAGRSQMAEGFFRKYLPKGFEPISAGTKPSDKVNPIVIQVMNEVGIDISKQIPKSISNDMIKDSRVVNMGCIDKKSCPALFLESVDDWNITDPKDKSIEQVREIRDQIENKVKEFVSNLEIN